MMFVQSLHGISHNKIEDTKEDHLELAVVAFNELADKAIRWIERAENRATIDKRSASEKRGVRPSS
jgi:hypothetical protein